MISFKLISADFSLREGVKVYLFNSLFYLIIYFMLI